MSAKKHENSALNDSSLDYFAEHAGQNWEFDANSGVAVAEKFFRNGKSVGDKCELLINHPFYLATGPGRGMNLEYWKDVLFLLNRMQSEHISLECSLKESTEVGSIVHDIKGLPTLKTLSFTCLESVKSAATDMIIEILGDLIIKVTADRSIIPFVEHLPHLQELVFVDRGGTGDVSLSTLFSLPVANLDLTQSSFVPLTDIGKEKYAPNPALKNLKLNVDFGDLDPVPESGFLASFKSLHSINKDLYVTFMADMIYCRENPAEVQKAVVGFSSKLNIITLQANVAELRCEMYSSIFFEEFPADIEAILKHQFPTAKIEPDEQGGWNLEYRLNNTLVHLGISQNDNMPSD